ncbi:MAG: DUF4145 domain-containing protein [Desulfobacula sp.]|jgi:hypothetical protein|nr:DUF4145 domain-containing protein [Desulfobacula sp.]
MKYVEPKSALKSFTCPHCGVLSRQYHWGYKNERNTSAIPEGHAQFPQMVIRVSRCEHCTEPAIWHKDKLVYPDRGPAPAPNPEMPNDIKEDYEEAASVLTRSPRGSAALLRLAIQKLCVHLGGDGKNINNDIQVLVTKGLPTQVQKALDVVRVTGNNAVHPGQIDTNDVDIASSLFPLVNVIVEYMIDMPNRISGLYEALPDSAKNAIGKRGSKQGNP